MMKKYLLLGFLFAPLLSFAAQVVRGPYLEDPTQTTLILRWETNEKTPAWLEYGPAPRCNQIMKISPESTEHKAVLYGLVPNQEFCYKLYVYNSAKDGLQAPVEGSFRTLYTPERKEVHFLAFGNTAGENQGAKALLSEQMAEQKADFVIHTGDITSTGLDADADAEFFKPYRDMLQVTPLFIALGANEYGPDRASEDSKAFLRTNYTRFHNMSWSNATPKYYSFDTANARFVFLDSNSAYGATWAPDLDEKSTQYKWLQTTLAGAPEKWKIVVLNAPLYSTGEKGPAYEVAARLVPLFERYGVDLVLQGAEADYERTFPLLKDATNPRGVTYITLGGGGATPKRRSGQHPSTARFVSNYHYADFHIVDRKLTMKVYNEQGKQIDKLEMYL
ncbi:MAG: metallophosphoesterase [Elusimicrobiaceae bacterium]|nr:metallophosphoesterase [Elusimicrobiaceae bacterium]